MTTKSLRRELRELLPVWLVCVSLPVPVLLFWQSVHGRSMALAAFFIGCTTLVAFSFQRDVRKESAAVNQPTGPGLSWSERMGSLVTALLAGFVVFSVICLIFNNPPESEEQAIWWRSAVFKAPRDLIAPMLAFMTLIPSLCLAPYLTLVTRSRFAAVVFSVFLVFTMKLLGAIVVVLVYGWDASEKGHTGMPWNRPDLLVWLFWGFTLALSVTFYFLGARRFHLARAAAPPASGSTDASPSLSQA